MKHLLKPREHNKIKLITRRRC